MSHPGSFQYLSGEESVFRMTQKDKDKVEFVLVGDEEEDGKCVGYEELQSGFRMISVPKSNKQGGEDSHFDFGLFH